MLVGSDTSNINTKDGKTGVVHIERVKDGYVLLKMEGGQRVWAPKEMLQEKSDGSYYLPLNMHEIMEQGRTADGFESETIRIIPIIQEELVVEKQKRETGRVRVFKHVEFREETVEEPGYIEELQFERVPVNEVIDSPQKARYEGNTLIIPLIEEELVVQKRLVLREELRVTKKRRETLNKQDVTLRREEVSIDRLEPERKRQGFKKDR
jgi:uncharacterized protein (TIGR02271 family)